MARILVAATATPGHVMPMLGIAGDLIGRGHRVHVLTGELFRDQVQRAGADFLPFDAEVDYDYRHLETNFPELWQQPPGNARMAFAFRTYFAGAIAVLDRQLRSTLASIEPDLILVENGFLGLLPLLNDPSARPPVVCVGVMPLAFSSTDSIFYGPRIPPAVLPTTLTRSQLVDHVTQRMIDEVQASFDATLLDLGRPPLELPFHDEMIVRPERFLQLSTLAFEYPRKDLPESVSFVGPLRRLRPPGPEPANLFDDNDRRPLVVVTQGTLANVDLSELIAPTLRALAEEPVRVVAATGGRSDLDPGHLPENARLTAFDDFSHWLGEASVLVTNGGYGSIQMALDAGVPLVVAGVGEDKKETATRVVWAGCGVDLKTSFPNETQLRDAVRQVVFQPDYRQRAATIRADFAGYDALDAIARHVASLAGTA